MAGARLLGTATASVTLLTPLPALGGKGEGLEARTGRYKAVLGVQTEAQNAHYSDQKRAPQLGCTPAFLPISPPWLVLQHSFSHSHRLASVSHRPAATLQCLRRPNTTSVSTAALSGPRESRALFSFQKGENSLRAGTEAF